MEDYVPGRKHLIQRKLRQLSVFSEIETQILMTRKQPLRLERIKVSKILVPKTHFMMFAEGIS